MPFKASLPDLTIRPAVAEDLPAVAVLHVECWRQAYAGQVDQAYLDNLDTAARLEMWRQFFSKQDTDPRFRLLLAFQAERLVGFISYAPPDSADGDIRIGALYLLRDVWSRGIGYALFTQAMEAIRAAGFTRPYLWVLDTNERAIAAYRRWGGRVDDETAAKTFPLGTQTLRELCVRFSL